jgi:hypothetical protein
MGFVARVGRGLSRRRARAAAFVQAARSSRSSGGRGEPSTGSALRGVDEPSAPSPAPGPLRGLGEPSATPTDAGEAELDTLRGELVRELDRLAEGDDGSGSFRRIAS